MFEDFRKQIDDSAFDEVNKKEGKPGDISLGEPRKLLGLTAIQRFFVAFMLLVMTIVLGILILVVTSKIGLPFTG